MTIITLEDRFDPGFPDEHNKAVLEKLLCKENKLFFYLHPKNRGLLLGFRNKLDKKLSNAQMNLLNPIAYEIQIWELLYENNYFQLPEGEYDTRNPFQQAGDKILTIDNPQNLLESFICAITGLGANAGHINFARVMKMKDLALFHGKKKYCSHMSKYHPFRVYSRGGKDGINISKKELITFGEDVYAIFETLDNINEQDFPYLEKDMFALESDPNYKDRIESGHYDKKPWQPR